jgi:hypothetical protein
MQTTETQSSRRLRGVVVDGETRAALRAFVDRVGWRPAIRALSVSERCIRRALDNRRIRIASATQIRLALATAQIGGKP